METACFYGVKPDMELVIGKAGVAGNFPIRISI